MPPILANNTNQDIFSSFNFTRNDDNIDNNEPTHTEEPAHTNTGGPVTIDVNKDLLSNHSINHSSTPTLDKILSQKNLNLNI